MLSSIPKGGISTMLTFSIAPEIKAGCPAMRLGLLQYQVKTEKINEALWEKLKTETFPYALKTDGNDIHSTTAESAGSPGSI